MGAIPRIRSQASVAEPFETPRESQGRRQGCTRCANRYADRRTDGDRSRTRRRARLKRATASSGNRTYIAMSSPTKDSDILRYYEAEMRYLRDAGKEFAHAFPDRARMLNIDR